MKKTVANRSTAVAAIDATGVTVDSGGHFEPTINKTMKMPNICDAPGILTRWQPPLLASVIRGAKKLFLRCRKVRPAFSENITTHEGTARQTNTRTLRRIRLERLCPLVALGHLLPGSGSETLAANLGMPSPAGIVISVPHQQLAVIHGGRVSAVYPISKFGLGDEFDSYKTPIGVLRVSDKIGSGLSLGSVIKNRSATGEVVAVDAAGRDAIVSRILCLEGQEPGNSNAYDRGIYIHGTPEESRLGQPVSWGCIRMRSRDIAQLFALVEKGTIVQIVNQRLAATLFKNLASPQSLASDDHTVSSIVADASSPYKLRLVPNFAAIPSNFLDIRWSVGISGWNAPGMRFAWESLSNRARR